MRLIAFVLLLAAGAFAQNPVAEAGPVPYIPAAVTTDPPQQADRKLAARMVELHLTVSDAGQYVPDAATHRLSAKERKLNGIMYVAAGHGPHPTVILLHGFPGNEQNLDLAQSIRRAGWNVFYFHYRGAWGSQGDFSFFHATEDTQAAINFVHDPKNVQLYSIDPERIVLVGHSMGGFMAAYAAANPPQEFRKLDVTRDGSHVTSVKQQRDLDVAGVVLISPWDLGRAANLLADKPENKKYIADATQEFRGYQLALHGFTAESGLAEIRSHQKQWQLTDIAAKVVDRKIPVLLTYGTFEDAREEGFMLLNDAFRADETKAGAPPNTFTTVVLPTDHAYSDQRIALQAAIVNWLERFKMTIEQ